MQLSHACSKLKLLILLKNRVKKEEKEIRYLTNTEINTAKWDKCINHAINGNVYVYSWFLDIVCEGWEALVMGDYETVMPLTSGKKFGVHYLYQPMFTQQLGVFSSYKIDEQTVKVFFERIPAKYKYIDIQLNIFNHFKDENFKITERITYELDLIETYEKLFANFNQNTRRNLGKVLGNKVSISNGLAPNDLISFYRTHVGDKFQNLKEYHYDMLRRLVSFAINHKLGEIFGAYTKENNLCALAFFLNSHHRSVFLISASSEEGKELRAMFLLVNYFISKHSEKNLTLDFEGSNIENIARFYAGFGAHPTKYPGVKRNRLPFFLKWLKQ